MQVLEGEVGFHDAGGLDTGAQHVLLGGHIGAMGYPIQVVEVAEGDTEHDTLMKAYNHSRPTILH